MNKRFRLKKAADFQRVRQHGETLACPFLVLAYQPNQTEQTRVGVAAGRAIGSAVARNRAKRLLRAAISPLLADIAPGNDLILIARKPILETKSAQVQQVLIPLLQKAELLLKNEK